MVILYNFTTADEASMTIKDYSHQKAFVITFYPIIQSEQKALQS